MRMTGKFLIWIGIAILILAGALAALLFILSTFDQASAELFGWAIILSMFFGLPAAIIAAVLVLVGAVLVTTAPKSDVHSAPPPHVLPAVNPNAPANKSRYVQTVKARAAAAAPIPSPEDALRAALQSNKGSLDTHLNFAVIGLRVLALALFAWFFLPDTYWTIKFALIIPNATIASVALVIVLKLIGAAILPLILWLISNVIKMKLPTGHVGLA